MTSICSQFKKTKQIKKPQSVNWNCWREVTVICKWFCGQIEWTDNEGYPTIGTKNFQWWVETRELKEFLDLQQSLEYIKKKIKQIFFWKKKKKIGLA